MHNNKANFEKFEKKKKKKKKKANLKGLLDKKIPL